MTKPLRVLIVEDSEDDVLLLLRDLRRGGYEPQFERVETAEAMQAALDKQTWDIVVSDYSLPNFNAPSALATLQESGVDLPFIIVSGTIGEDAAISSLKAGAHDFIVKGSTARLIPAIEREMRESAVRQERRQAQQALHQNEKRFRALIENSSDAIALIAADGTNLYGSPAVAQILGYTPEQWVGRNGYQLVHPADLEHARAFLEGSLEGAQRIEFRLQHCDGTYRWVEAVSTNLLAEPSVQAIVINFRDISERKQADETLRRYSERLQTLHRIDQAILKVETPEKVAELVLDFIRQQIDVFRASVILFNAETTEGQILAVYSQRKSKLVAGASYPMAIFPEGVIDWMRTGAPYIVETLSQLLQTIPTVQALQEEGLRSLVWVPLVVQGQLIGTLNLGSDTLNAFDPQQLQLAHEVADQLAIAIQQGRYREQIERHSAELEQRVLERTSELQQAKESIEAILNSSSDAILLTTFDGVIKQFNPAFTEQFGYAFDDVVGHSLLILTTPDDMEAMIDVMHNVVNEGKPKSIEVVGCRQDGSTFDIDLAIAPVQNGQSIRGMVCSIRDITERKQVERALQASEEKYRALVNFAPDPIVIADNTGRIVLVNERTKETFGYEPAELIGQPVEKLIPERFHSFRPLDYASEFMSSTIKRPEDASYDVVLMAKGGSEIPVQIGLSPIQTGGEELVMAYIVDMTSQRRLEESLRAALVKEKELSELRTRFISMVSHDFRTPLTVIRSSTDILQMYYDRLDDERKSEHYEKIRKQIERMIALLNDVLTISRSDAGKMPFNPILQDLDAFCRSIADEFQDEPELKHKLVYTASDRASEVPIDGKLMQQAISNLLTNAFKYSPEGSTVLFDLSFNDDEAVIRIRDSGIGIPEADQPHLYETFHRAGNVGGIQGTGLGLAIVKRSVEAHGGTIEFESQVGVGTTFIVRLPRMLQGEMSRGENPGD
ncbi:MAG: PAS domain S-box protein [Anaerolineae bacterium]|nr:PAS domain S-box protein [Anaerolineae bacterium]